MKLEVGEYYINMAGNKIKICNKIQENPNQYLGSDGVTFNELGMVLNGNSSWSNLHTHCIMKKQLGEYIPNGKISQMDWVVLKLCKDGSITRNQCLRTYISRLSSYICQLKKQYVIDTESVVTDSYWGKAKDYKYTISDSSRKLLGDAHKELIEQYQDMEFDYKQLF